jgi:hypothetical protein
MRPAIWHGDVVLVEPPAHALPRIGEIVMSLTPEGIVRIHRVVSVDERRKGRVTTKGDSLRLPDAPVLPDSVIGRVRRVERNGRSIRLDGPFWGLAGGFLARFWRLGPHLALLLTTLQRVAWRVSRRRQVAP